jgi:hypothetical protein
MKYTGDTMRKEHQTINSIDKILDYIEHDIENPEKEPHLGDLIDVHTLLTQLKVKHIENDTEIKSTDDDLFIYSYMVMNSFKMVFGNWEANTTVIDGRVLLCNDLTYIDINRDEGKTECIVSFYHIASPVVVGEVINTLKDIFGAGLKVSSEVFTTDEATGKYIWGEDNIKQHIRNINGNKIRPILFFDDDTVGNS